VCKSLIRSCYVHNHMINKFYINKYITKCDHCRLNLNTCFSIKSKINQDFKIRIWVERHFQQYFSYTVAVSFIGERHRSTRRKPLTCLKTSFITWLDMAMVLNATFKNISAILWRSVLLAEETGVPRENYRTGFELTTLVVINTHCTGSCKSNYHTLTTMTAPLLH
jgi:hypothetical protein